MGVVKMMKEIGGYLDEETRISLTRELSEKGYCIIKDVLTPRQVNMAKEMFYDWKGTIPEHDKMHSKVDPHGIYKHHQVGHQRHAWYIRTRPKVQAMYKYLWNRSSLISSFDGCCYIDKMCKKRDNCWTHTDQGSRYEGVCYQGFVSLTDNKERTLVVYEGSHLYHREYFKEKGLDTSKNWNLIDTDTLKSMESSKRVLEVPAGSLVIWDSRCFHQNQYGKECSEERLVQYVCYFPSDHKDNTEKMVEKRVKYFNELRTTSHWPCRIKVNGDQPRTYGDNNLKIDYSTLRAPYLDDMMMEIHKLL
jgi:ectoine hydroxylase-related dioxygenase (phytanoyl-CoA dioxygenase family)